MKAMGMLAALSLALAFPAEVALADPWNDESGKGRWRGGYEGGDDGWRGRGYYRDRRAYKEEYRRGGCKIEREWDGDEYKEEIKCKRGWRPPAYGYYPY